MKKYLFTFPFYILFLFSSAFTKTMTLDQCLGQAFLNNPDLQKARKSCEAAQSRLYQSATYFLPTLSVGGNYTHLNEEPPAIDFQSLMTPGAPAPQISGNPLLQYSYQDNYNAYIRVTQPLFTGGRIYYQYKSYYTDYNIHLQELKLTRADLEINIIKAFYSVILAKEMEVLAVTATNTLEQHLIRISELVKNGAVTDYDKLKAESLLLTWQVTYSKSIRNLKNSLRNLKSLMRYESDEAFDVNGKLDYEDDEILNTETATTNALRQRPEIIIADESIKISRYSQKIKRSALLPQANFQYNYYLYDQDKSLTFNSDKWQNYWDIRLLLTWDIFTWGRHISEVRESSLNREKSEIDAVSIQDRIKNEVADVYDLHVQNKKAVEAYKKDLDVKKRSYAIVNENYKNGTMIDTDVLDAEISLLDARIQYLKALYDYKLSNLDFKRVAGLMYGNN